VKKFGLNSGRIGIFLGFVFILNSILTVFAELLNPSIPREKAGQIVNLRKIGEIGESFSKEENGYFWRISDICCDRKGNLYVADSGWNRITKFNSSKGAVLSFGRAGQGPGEFLSDSGSTSLKISCGNDEKIYVTDPSNARAAVFAEDGKYLRAIPLQIRYDRAVANKGGDVYLLGKGLPQTICCFGANLKQKACFLDRAVHFQFPLEKPKNKIVAAELSDQDLQKRITRKDELVVLSNYALKAFIFGRENKLEKEFAIKETGLLDDIKTRLIDILRKSERGFLDPFNLILDQSDNLCLLYFNRKSRRNEMYRYSLDGRLLDISIFPERINMIGCVANDGRIYAVMKADKIGIFEISDY
jgi:hypothetical protein